MQTTLQPVLRAEFRHQRYVIQQGRVGLIWILLAAALILPAIVATVHFMRLALLPLDLMGLVDALGIATGENGLWSVVLIVAAISMVVVVTFITYGLSANSISREKRGNTWDNLILTKVPPRSIVWGKWLASLRAVLGDHGISIFLRLGLVSYALLIMRATLTTGDPIAIPTIIGIWLVTIGFGVLDAGASAALGILTALQEGASGAVMTMLLLAVRLALTAWGVFWTYLVLQGVLSGLTSTPFLVLIGIMVFGVTLVGTLLLAERRVM
jgi:hypothetical protein